MSAGGELISDVGEFGLITRIDAALDGQTAGGVHVGIGDDAAQAFLDEGGGDPEDRLGAEPGRKYRGRDDR